MATYDVVEFMTKRKWDKHRNVQRMRYLHQVAKDSKNDPDIAAKIGGILIYNQVIEQFLADIVKMSIYYIKAQIWPVEVELDVDLDKSTFGKIIEYFKQYATVEPNRDQILADLKKFNSKRNQVVHDLFDIENLSNLAKELDEYADLADKILKLLMEYEKQVMGNFCQLSDQMDFCSCKKS